VEIFNLERAINGNSWLGAVAPPGVEIVIALKMKSACANEFRLFHSFPERASRRFCFAFLFSQ